MSEDIHPRRRRTVLAGLATATASLAGCGALESDSPEGEETPTTTPEDGGDEGVPQIRLGARADAWVGVQPEGIEEQENPSLVLRSGTPYEIVWENLDGEEHELLVLDGDGEELAASDASATEGDTVTLELTAEEEMEEYLCEYHPEEMRGEITIANDE